MANELAIDTASAAPPPADAGSRRAFFDTLIDALRRELPGDLADFTTRGFGNLIKIAYRNERVHYEVWIETDKRRVGLGLHFEDGPASTAAYLRFFDARIVELKDRLGPEIDFGRWTTSWGHLYELRSCPALTRDAARQAASRLAELIVVLEPMVRSAQVMPERSAMWEEAPAGSHWRRRGT